MTKQLSVKDKKIAEESTIIIFALVAQQVEHHHGKVGVSGSNPDKGSISKH